MKKIELENWKRREYFEFFSHYDDPMWGIVAEVDCTRALHSARKMKESFFIRYLYCAIYAANQIEELRTRITENGAVIFSKIHASSTIGRDNGDFGFSFIEYHPDFSVFSERALQEINLVRACDGLRVTENASRPDVIHFSSLPWIRFTALSHAHNFKDCVPKISFGKYYENSGKIMMPVSLHAHHALVDGYHAGRFFELMQQTMDEE